VGFSLGVAGAYAGRDIGPAIGPQLRAVWHASEEWSLALLGAMAVFGGGIRAAEGTATTRQDLGLLEIGFTSSASHRPVHYMAMVGGGAYHLSAIGESAALGYETLQGHESWSALLSAGVGVRLPWTGAAAVVFDIRELVTLPRPVVNFGGHRVADSMHPGTLAGVSLAVDL
jgi:hypothetical protein